MEVETGKRTNILAAAGRMREIRLLHPEQLVCYAEMKGHTEDVTAMIFHQTQSTILFSGDSKVINEIISTCFILFVNCYVSFNGLYKTGYIYRLYIY